jgi:hypothetical protein
VIVTEDVLLVVRPQDMSPKGARWGRTGIRTYRGPATDRASFLKDDAIGYFDVPIGSGGAADRVNVDIGPNPFFQFMEPARLANPLVVAHLLPDHSDDAHLVGFGRATVLDSRPNVGADEHFGTDSTGTALERGTFDCLGR